jgi:hypothetical protein
MTRIVFYEVVKDLLIEIFLTGLFTCLFYLRHKVGVEMLGHIINDAMSPGIVES